MSKGREGRAPAEHGDMKEKDREDGAVKRDCAQSTRGKEMAKAVGE
jgi:hypothetical protein